MSSEENQNLQIEKVQTGLLQDQPVARQPLQVVTVERDKIAVDLGLSLASKPQEQDMMILLRQSSEVTEAAEKHFQTFVNVDPMGASADQATEAAATMGVSTQNDSGRKNALLEQQIKKLAESGSEGKLVAEGLKELRVQMQDLDPTGFNFEGGLANAIYRFFRIVLPKTVADPIQRYFMKYQSSQAMIDAILRSLKHGREMLERDNETMRAEQKEMRILTLRLMRVIALGEVLLDRLSEYVKTLPEDDPKRKFLEEQAIFILNQRVISLQKQLAVNQQGYMAMEVLIQNNRELIRGVMDAENITISALRIAVMVAVALANQKLVLDRIEALNAFTDKMLLSNAQLLRSQGVQIQKRSAEGQLSLETLKKAFIELKGAIEDVENFRREALPRQASLILELNMLTADAEKHVQKIEHGHEVKPMIDFNN